MINLKRIIEQQGTTGQYYDLNKDFANFRRMVDGADDQIRQKYEQAINAKLAGKRILARASRGFKQYVKVYEFDVVKVTLDDYYDTYVVIAHDNTTPKAKEYFLKPGFKITILGPATGQPSPQKGGKPEEAKPESTPPPRPISPQENPNLAQAQPMALAPAGNTPSEDSAVKEDSSNKHFDAYSIDTICQDIEPWLKNILKKPETALRDFVKGIGWQTRKEGGKTVSLYDLKIPVEYVKIELTPEILRSLITRSNTNDGTSSTQFEMVNARLGEDKSEWVVRIKKTTIKQ